MDFELNFEKVVNLTPNTVRLFRDGQRIARFDPCGEVAEIQNDVHDYHSLSGEFEVRDTTIRDIENLPDFKQIEGNLYIVARPVGFAIAESDLFYEGDVVGKGRPDIVIPSSFVHNSRNEIVGCERFERYWKPF